MQYQPYKEEIDQHRADIAEDDLNRIAGFKQDLAKLLKEMRSFVASDINMEAKEYDLRYAAAMFDDAFDDLFSDDYKRLLQESGSLTLPSALPRLEFPIVTGDEILKKLPNPAMSGFNANRAAREAEGEI